MNKDYFDSVEKNPLTKSQRYACASDEDATLVIAGAGTGKTSTILAKIGLLIRSGQCSPSEVLAISFTNKSAKELEARVQQRLGLEARVSTFHKVGLDILARSHGGRPRLAPFAHDPVEKTRYVESIIVSLVSDSRFRKQLLEYCAYHSFATKQIWNFQSLAEYKNWLRSNKIISLDGVPKKSLQECLIANWLILNGVPFEYERPYEKSTKDINHRQYCPDFWLPSVKLYIEHFGVDEEGNTASFIDPEKYWEGILWKRAIHRQYRTSLLETYSWEHSKGSLLYKLDAELKARGCVFSPLSEHAALANLNKAGVLNRFAEISACFLTLYKGNGNALTNFSSGQQMLGDRERAFLDLFFSVFNEYEKRNRESDQIDFEDMITGASEAIESGAFQSPYKYILIDEFQDISTGRAKLVKTIRENVKDCAVFAVGDDWQSIYRFAGSDIGSMTHFAEIFGATRRLVLDTTFRFDDQAVAVSSEFILRNKAQIPKTLGVMHKSVEPSLILYRLSSGEEPLEWALNEIARLAQSGAEVLLLERYNHDLPEEPEWKRLCRAFPELRLSKMSIHAAKGLEADYVVMGLRGGEWGFPSQKLDDPLLDLVLSQADEYPHGEERRLFYVAITRAKRKTFLVCEAGQNLSDFAVELAEDGRYPIQVVGEDAANRACPECKSGTLLLRGGENKAFFGCSNYPLCRYTEQACPSCGKGLLTATADGTHVCDVCGHRARACPECGSGILLSKKGPYGDFFGCSNHRVPGINCTYTE